MRRNVLSLAAASSAALLLSAGTMAPAHAQEREPAAEEAMVELINEAREAQGAPPLTVYEPMNTVDRGGLEHTFEMAEAEQLWHPADWSQANQDAGCSVSGAENVGMAGDTDSLFDAFMNSSGHRANIMNPDYEYVAVATVETDDGVQYQTQRFAEDC